MPDATCGPAGARVGVSPSRADWLIAASLSPSWEGVAPAALSRLFMVLPLRPADLGGRLQVLASHLGFAIVAGTSGVLPAVQPAGQPAITLRWRVLSDPLVGWLLLLDALQLRPAVT